MDSKVEDKIKPKPRGRNGGRTKGTPNKPTQDLFEICAKHGINVFEGLIKFCSHPEDSYRFNAHKEAAKYLYPTRKAVEMKAEVTNVDEKNKQIEELKSRLDAIES